VDFHARFPIEKINNRKTTLWRYREALPLEKNDAIVSFDEGFTPLIHEQIDGKPVYVKLDYLFPSGSYKDRGASVLISKVKELGVSKVVEDSSGNAGAAIAAYCAKAHIACEVYVPEKTSAGKLIQIKSYGAKLHKIPGSREDTAAAVWDAAQHEYYASHYWNPYFFHGTKTCVFEIVEQLGWNAPDTIIVAVGNGTLVYGTFIGLREMLREHIIDTLPRIIAVQAKNCAPLVHAWNAHQHDVQNIPVTDTIAEGIAIAHPIRAKNILSAVKETNGEFISVTEQEIVRSLRMIRRKGYYIEPTSAVAIAGLLKYSGADDETVVIPLTGHGLKSNGTLVKIK
jgi:threonine synthase